MIPPEQNGSFVANMEMLLDVYKRPYDAGCPVVCMDESPKQLIAETRVPFHRHPGDRPGMTMNTGVVGCATFFWPASRWRENA